MKNVLLLSGRPRRLARFLPLALLACFAPMTGGAVTPETVSPPRADDIPGEAVDELAFVAVRALERTAEGWTITGPVTVLVRDGRIAEIGPVESTRIPPAARVVDGAGRFLSPGLVDTHAHLDMGADVWMGAFLANGVTTVFNLRGGAPHLELRAAVAEGRLAGPVILTSGPFTNQPAIATPEAARRAVAEQRAAGYDFLKIHGDLDRPTFAAMIEAGRAHHLPITGHIPRNLPATDALELGQDWIAHAEELMYTAFRTHDTTGVGAMMDDLAARRIALSPTLRTFRNIARQWARPGAVDSALALPHAAFLSPVLRNHWLTRNPYTDRVEAGVAWSASAYAFQRVLVDRAADAGVLLMTGTDTPLPVMFPGASVIEEMGEFVAAGVPRDLALDAATRNPAIFIRERAPLADGSFGEILPRRLARLVLLDHNPLDSFDTFRRPAGVLANGRWYDAEALARIRDRVATQPPEQPGREVTP